MIRDPSPVSLPTVLLARRLPHCLRPTHAGALGGVASLVFLTLAIASASLGCGGDHAEAAEAGPEDATAAVNVCDIDAFTGVGTACPAPSALVCFPQCEAGGCSCQATPDGPRWACVTDRSCLPSCAPIDDACAAEASLYGDLDAASE
jgi:hypothetical protein